MKTIGDLISRPLDRKIEEIIQVDQADEQSVHAEISEYVATDSIRDQYHLLLKAVAEAPADPQAASPERVGEVMNFGETLAYWYFRLNGFFPLTNFVLHEVDSPRKYNADADLLAVRFPHVYEEIGGKHDDWDDGRFDQWELDHEQQTVCLICEVKTGEYDAESLNRAFCEARLLYALRRFGVLPEERCVAVCQAFMTQPVVKCEGFTFAKVLMCSKKRQQGRSEPMTPCQRIELDEAVRFIEQRMKKYSRQKSAARMFFPGDLIQFFAWSAGVKLADGDGDSPCDFDPDGVAQGMIANSPAAGSPRGGIRQSRPKRVDQ